MKIIDKRAHGLSYINVKKIALLVKRKEYRSAAVTVEHLVGWDQLAARKILNDWKKNGMPNPPIGLTVYLIEKGHRFLYKISPFLGYIAVGIIVFLALPVWFYS